MHGFADYFFHTEYAEWWAERGYTFYAVDLRKYGRSLRDHQTPNYVGDLREYFAELDLAWWRITQRDAHTEVITSGHSTGGLTLPLWANERRPAEMTGMVLNSPWFDMQGSAWLRSPAARLAIDRLGTRQPMQAIPRRVNSLYAMSIHRSHGGEFDYDLAWKPIDSRPVYAGWLRAIRRGHAELHARPRHRLPRAGAVVDAQRVPRRDERRRARQRHRARRPADPQVGVLARTVTSPASPSTVPCTTSCCPGRRCARRAYDHIDTWLRRVGGGAPRRLRPGRPRERPRPPRR